MHHHSIRLLTDDDRSSFNVNVLNAISLNSHPFIIEYPYFCSTFSECVRKGNGLELSGSESFLGLVLPLVKSLLHFEQAVTPPKTAIYFDLYLTLGVAVVDAPMIGVRVNENTKELAFLPWIRVIRNEYSEGSHSWDKGKAFAIDIVHKDFLQDYVEKYTLSFAREFSHLAVKHDKVLASGAGFVSGLWKNGLQDIEKN